MQNERKYNTLSLAIANHSAKHIPAEGEEVVDVGARCVGKEAHVLADDRQ